MENTFLWTTAYSVGIDLLDDQHKTLLGLANDLVLNCIGAAEDAIKPYFKKQIAVILDYLAFHFRMEEQLLNLIRFSGAAAHKRGHARCIREIHFWLGRTGSLNLQVMLSFARYLRERILDHVAEEDQGYGGYILSMKNRGSRLPCAKYA
jgi:hemerythrin-like metal-binding protein